MPVGNRHARVANAFDRISADRTTAKTMGTATEFPASSTRVSFAVIERLQDSGTG